MMQPSNLLDPDPYACTCTPMLVRQPMHSCTGIFLCSFTAKASAGQCVDKLDTKSACVHAPKPTLLTVQCCEQDMENVVGDVVVAAGCIAYSGPFTPAFRQLLQQEWIALLQADSVPHTPGTSLIGTLQVSKGF